VEKQGGMRGGDWSIPMKPASKKEKARVLFARLSNCWDPLKPFVPRCDGNMTLAKRKDLERKLSWAHAACA